MADAPVTGRCARPHEQARRDRGTIAFFYAVDIEVLRL
jgi:hypothetical protein